MSNTTVSHLQNAAIAVLTISAVFLLTQTPLFGNLAGKTPYELAQDFFLSDPTLTESVAADASDLSLPVRVVFTNEYARLGIDAVTTTDASFEQAGTFFSEAIGSAGTLEACKEADLLSALQGSSIYLELEAETPLELLSEMLGVTAPASDLLHVRRLLLTPTESGTMLYLEDSESGCYVCRTDGDAYALNEALAALDGNGTDFAFALPGDFSQLSPYTLIFNEPVQRNTLSVASALSDKSTFLRLAEFNPHTENSYTDSAGNTVIREVYGTLRLQPDGTAVYQGDSAESGSLYYVNSAASGKPTLSESIAGAQKLVFTLLRDFCGDAELYLSGVENGSKHYTITFDYAVAGTPLHFSDGSHAASVTIEGQSITSFTLHCRSYTVSDSPALLLPIRQAAAIAGSKYLNAELHVCYEDRGADTASPAWFAD